MIFRLLKSSSEGVKKFYQAHNKISKNHSDFELIDLEEVLGHMAKRVKQGVFLLTLGEIIR